MTFLGWWRTGFQDQLHRMAECVRCTSSRVFMQSSMHLLYKISTLEFQCLFLVNFNLLQVSQPVFSLHNHFFSFILKVDSIQRKTCTKSSLFLSLTTLLTNILKSIWLKLGINILHIFAMISLKMIINTWKHLSTFIPHWILRILPSTNHTIWKWLSTFYAVSI